MGDERIVTLVQKKVSAMKYLMSSEQNPERSVATAAQ
jgi:hypothetical protein